MNKIGFSCGVLYRVMDVHTKEAFDTYLRSGSELIEISIDKAQEVDRLDEIASFVEKYPYKSIHLPSIKYRNDNQTRHVLDKVSTFYNSIGANLILVHPDVVEDWSIFDKYPLTFAIENMDNRKQSYRHLDDIQKFFEQKPDWKMVLDLNHCYSNDRSMKLAEDFLAKFKDIIAEIHLSGYIDCHEPLYKTKQNEIMQFCIGIDAPIIIESTFYSAEEVKKEIDYIKNYLRK